MRRLAKTITGLAVLAAGTLAAAGGTMGGAQAAGCRNTGDFGRWLEDFKTEARTQGISARVISSSLDGLRYDPSIVRKDRAQSVFSQSFLEFSNRMVSGYRMKQGTRLLKQNASEFRELERKYGVPGPVIVGFWGLETDFGANIGNLPVMNSLATLAFDCRRPDLFREQLMYALKIAQRGDLRPDQMIGAWAGELGQLQFQPKDYFELGVDYNGNGRVDLLKEVPDVLASGARLIQSHGWRAGEPWLVEVRVPRSMPWVEAGLETHHGEAKWSGWGVTARDGSPLKSTGLEASLLLPMGRNGPAFLAYPNFDVYLQWNQSLVYATTAAYFATRLAGAPPRFAGNGDVDALSFNEIKTLQHILQNRGYDVGGVDGMIGANTRSSVRDVQAKLGLPVDGYPTKDLLRRLAGQ
ncbi:lytic murein transglycosylase [Breoghania corrubedonensis]|uniref:Lytic murein transglycosylase n=1 Tax=Breoghania corrubedonensis TaxID=665038 RepID=A0A2T5V7N4_9HYPH|nr:lytic murein transglycosylase [Breoghania corrubedonensis]PTW59762.1 lytic murein transglycosylase [Breoghania corrubedonensis]